MRVSANDNQKRSIDDILKEPISAIQSVPTTLATQRPEIMKKQLALRCVETIHAAFSIEECKHKAADIDEAIVASTSLLLMSLSSRNHRYVVDVKNMPLDKTSDDRIIETSYSAEEIDATPVSPHRYLL
jgi:hypothetical protein